MQIFEIELDSEDFLASLKDPGTVYLHSLPLSRLVDRILAASTFQKQGEKNGYSGLGW
ncbi:hypothetical protein [Methanohalobium sp.]|uniref:hypothetical protein n=1 Tax=Methanohalobium sp. TaxID=2837493 RepID=UPI0025EF8EDD|nr:hypothetical protein [Methanohalobium sp.]